ncbi:MAG TPA: hypothetical protein VK525_01485 [Candidatus Saccharimonadales bacterium]|nr:hypothetical protein [Candidatus Saccharimonadales bacterium]
MTSSTAFPTLIRVLLSQPFAATHVQDRDGHEGHSRGKKNKVKHMLLVLEMSDFV